MNLSFDTSLADGYTNNSQKIRRLTEHWVEVNMFCPSCGGRLHNYENNRPFADFHCPICVLDFELKSKKNSFGKKIASGDYTSMIAKLQNENKQNMMFLSYLAEVLETNDFFVVPKHFIIPEIIEERTPLKETARRAGWIGGNILFDKIPQAGHIYYIRKQIIIPKQEVLEKWAYTLFLQEVSQTESKGWLIDIMHCIDSIGKNEFTLSELYEYEKVLAELHPENNHIKDKIRQQLQVLRDKGYLNFEGRGEYRLTRNIY